MRNVVRSPELARDEGRNPQFVRSPELARDEGRNSLYEPRTYRGTDLEQILPRIREELGEDAMVVRQREGLHGGVGGFFQKRCVEVVARRAAPGVNTYDEAPAAPVAPALPEPALELESESPAIREIMRVASPFVEKLEAAQAHVDAALRESAGPQPASLGLLPSFAPERELAPEAVTAEPAPRTGASASHERALVAAGIAPALAAEILAATVSHGVPFAPNRALKHLVRAALAARIPVCPPVAAGRRTIAFVGAGGAGKTLCATRIAEAYAEGSDLEVRIVDLAAGAPAAPAATGHVITVVDTPAVTPAADARSLARALRRIGPCEVHVAVPATLSASAATRLLDGLAPLKPAAVVLTHLDEVDHPGPVLDAVIARGLPLSFCNEAGAIAPADPSALAARVLA